MNKGSLNQSKLSGMLIGSPMKNDKFSLNNLGGSNKYIGELQIATFLNQTLSKLKKPNKRTLKPIDKDTLLKF
jgi:hypothetical protein